MSDEKVERFSTTVEEEAQPRRQLLPFAAARENSSPSSFQAPNFFNSNGQAGTHRDRHGFSDQSHLYQQPSDLFSMEETKYISISISLKDKHLCDNHGAPAERTQNAPIKWMSSKMRLMRKMMTEERISTMNKPRRRIQRRQCQSLLNREMSTETRVCSDCSTTKTPLWRSGPQGPKSLCNACGIRQMKARRAVVTSPATPPGDAVVLRNISERFELAVMKKEKKYDVDRTVPYKKRHKFTNPIQESSPPFLQAFPQDEKDAAILLMALSCGGCAENWWL